VAEVPVYVYDQEDARFYGLEFEGDFGLAQWDNAKLRLKIFGDYTRGELDSGEDVPRLPPRRLGARLTWLNDHWNIYGAFVDAAEQDRPGAYEDPTDGYLRWDAGVEFRTTFAAASEIVLFARFKNISDEEIRLSTSFLRDFAPEAGRSLEGGIRLVF